MCSASDFSENRGVSVRHRSTAVAAALGIGLGTALAAFPATASADGSTLYVNSATAANCSDSAADAGTAAQPYCGVQAAVDAARPGDTVLIAAGVYKPVDVRTSGTASSPITITGVSISASVVTPVGGSGPALTFDHVQNVVVDNVFVGTNVRSASVVVTGSSNVTMDRSRISGDANARAIHPALTVDGQSSSFTLSRSQVQMAGGSQSAVAVAAGASGTVLTTNAFSYTRGPAVSAVDAPGTVVVANNVTGGGYCTAAISLTGASTGATIENNVVKPGTGQACGAGTGTPIVVAAGSTGGTTEDYDTIETASTDALYSWAGQEYSTPAELRAATGSGAHDTSLLLTPATTADQQRAPLIDSADALAPDELSIDASGKARVDDPVVADTGTGVGYYDRGATDYQDPYKVTLVLSAAKGPGPLVETVTAGESNPWHTKIGSYTFDFGDGSDPVVSTSPTATHTYTALGSYTAAVRATSAAGTVFPASGLGVQVVAATAPMVPVLNMMHISGTSSLTVRADGYSTIDDWSVAGNTVDFGDGTAPATFGRFDNDTHTYAEPGTYTAKLTVKDDGGNTATTTRQVVVGSALVPFGPVRFLDTRNGTGAAKAKVGPGKVVRLKVTGVKGVPGTGVTAVTLNLTGVDATADTWIAAYPDGTPVPTASNLNLAPQQTTPNLVTVPVSADGYVDLYNHAGSVDLIADIEGYYSTTAPVEYGSSTGGFVLSQTPTRVLDTRTGQGTSKGRIGPGYSASFDVPLPPDSDASAVVLNVTETDATAASYVGVEQDGGVPTTSVLNFRAKDTTSNQVVVPIDQYGQVSLYNHTGSVDLVADVQGYVIDDGNSGAPMGSPYFPVDPTRVLDTRHAIGAPTALLGAKSKLVVKVAGTKGIPAGVTSVLLNLTGADATAATWLSAYADGSPLPFGSNLNLAAGAQRAVLALVPVGSDGSIDIYNATGKVNVVADIEGYYTG